MSKRNYTHIRELLPAIHAMVAEGRTQREIAEHFGFKDKEVVREALKRKSLEMEQILSSQNNTIQIQTTILQEELINLKKEKTIKFSFGLLEKAIKVE